MRSALLRHAKTPTRTLRYTYLHRPVIAVPPRRCAQTRVTSPPKTYFQDPPSVLSPPQPRRPSLLWRFVRGSAIALIAFGFGLLVNLDIEDEEDMADEPPVANSADLLESFVYVINRHRAEYQQFWRAVRQGISEPSDLGRAESRLGAGRVADAQPGLWFHGCYLPTNAVSNVVTSFGDIGSDWSYWGLFDGHNGAATAQSLANAVPNTLISELSNRPDSDTQIPGNEVSGMQTLITETLRSLDLAYMNVVTKAVKSDTIELADLQFLRAASSGTSALVTLYNRASRQLLIANAGDSQAVGGSWDAAKQRYKAYDVAPPQTGNKNEDTKILQPLHPGEQILDPQTKAILERESPRSVGDAGWKLPGEIVQIAHKTFGTPKPRERLETPPYPIGTPTVHQLRIDLEPQPDFLILASRGFWEKMSPEDAVQCVVNWKEKFDLNDTTDKFAQNPMYTEPVSGPEPTTVPKHLLKYNESTGKIGWEQSREHWVTERSNCAEHLIQNALGGSRRGLAAMILTTPPPYSEKFFNDMSVCVIFFGEDETTDVA